MDDPSLGDQEMSAFRIKKGFRWCEVNLKFLTLKLFALFIAHVPCKVFLLRAFGVFLGLSAMFLRRRQWNAIVGFARHTGSPLSPQRYVLKYSLQRGIDQAWEVMFYEAERVLGKYYYCRKS